MHIGAGSAGSIWTTGQGVIASVPAVNPGTICGVKLVDYWQSHLGITLNGTDVSAWTGQTNGVVLAQPTASKQPLYDTVNTLNGHAVLAPAGAEGLTLPALGCASSPRATFAIVRFTTNVTPIQCLIEANADFTAAGIGMNYSFSSTNSIHLNCTGGTGSYTFIRTTAAALGGAWRYSVSQYDTTQVADLDQMSFRRNGADIAMTDSVGSATSGNLGNGSHSIFSSNNCANYCWAGMCACIVLCNDTLTAGELAALESWMASEYGL